MDSMSFNGYQEYDYAQKTQAEPWLYDRSAGEYELYLRSGFATALREAVRSADFYADHLDNNGFFTLKPGDPAPVATRRRRQASSSRTSRNW
jgi:hypothetical protein